MLRLTEEGIAWRNYFFANEQGTYDKVNNFEIYTSLISDDKDDLVKEMLGKERSYVIEECKEDIEFQKEKLESILKDFREYCVENKLTVPNTEMLIMDLVNNDVESGLYKIIQDWKESYLFIDSICNSLEKKFDIDIYMRDEICKTIMNEIYKKNVIGERKYER